LCQIKDSILDCEEDTIVATNDSVGLVFINELETDPECESCGLWVEGFNIIENDTIRGQQATVENVVITQLTGTSIFSVINGKLYIKAATDANLSFEYQICDINDNTFCDTALVSINATEGDAELLNVNPTQYCTGSDLEEVTINGKNFYGSTPTTNVITDVLFDGVSAQSFTIVNRETIVALPPVGVTEGEITVVSPVGVTGSPIFFSVVTPPVVNPITGDDTVCTEDTLVLGQTSTGGTWSSSNESVATVVGGTVTPISEGKVDINYSVTDLGCTTVVSKTINVYEKVELGRFATTRTAIPGGSDSFYVEATGSGLTYQWFIFDGIDIFAIDALTSYDVETYSGFTTNVLRVSDISENISGLQYFCEIDGISPCTGVTTNNVTSSGTPTLNVASTGISVHPQDQEDCEGESVVFTMTAIGDPVNTYQWEYDESDEENWNIIPTGTLDGMAVTGETTDTLTISNILLTNSGYRFRCVATGDTNQATSDFGILIVNEC